MLRKLLRYTAPVILLAASFTATALTLGPNITTVLCVVGVWVQVIGVGAVTVLLLLAEAPGSERTLWTHVRHSWLLWLVALGEAEGAAYAGQFRDLAWFLVLLAASGLVTNFCVVVAYRLRQRAVAA